MTKSENREISVITRYHAAGLEKDWVARSLSALYRSARSKKSQTEIMAIALMFGVVNHPEFIA